MGKLLDKIIQQAQTPVNIRSIESGVSIPTSASDPIDNGPLIADALNRILADYGATVSVSNKAKNLLKFGRNPNVGTAGTAYTIWYTGQDQANETYVADNANSIDTVSSNNINDTELIRVEGHTMTGGERTFVVQNVTLQGQGKVTLPTPLNRCTRIANLGSNDLVGEIYAYQDGAITNGKPNDTTTIHLTVRAGQNQSEKASTSLSSGDYWIVTGFRTSLLEKAGSLFADTSLQFRRVGGVFRPIDDIAVSSTSPSNSRNFNPYIIIPANSDVRLISIASAGNTDVTGSIQGYLAN